MIKRYVLYSVHVLDMVLQICKLYMKIKFGSEVREAIFII